MVDVHRIEGGAIVVLVTTGRHHPYQAGVTVVVGDASVILLQQALINAPMSWRAPQVAAAPWAIITTTSSRIASVA